MQRPVSASGSEASNQTKTTEVEEEQASDVDHWNSNYEFIAFCIGKHSTLSIYEQFQHVNFLQDLIIYLLFGVPVSYLQMILGQYTHAGIFLIRRMLPTAEGISYVYFMTIFILTIIIVRDLETNFIYFILSIAPFENIWTLCPPEHKDICWDFTNNNCTVEAPCINEAIRLPTYLFWNYTYMQGAYPPHLARVGTPERQFIWVTVVSWLSIYLSTMLTFRRVKTVVQVLVSFSVIFKLLILFKFGSFIGIGKLFAHVLTIDWNSWLSFATWETSIQRVISSMMLGDFTYIMFGVYTTYQERTGCMSFIGAISGYCILLIEVICIQGGVDVLLYFAKLPPEDQGLLFVPHAPDPLIIIPAAISILPQDSFWTPLYFASNIITYLAWCIINTTFMELSLYQRFSGMASYYKYVCPTIYLIGFCVGLVMQTKEIYEVRYNLMLTVDLFCQHINLILLTVMCVYIYGFKRLGDDIQFMTGKQPAKFWKVTWIMAPIFMMVTTTSKRKQRDFQSYKITLNQQCALLCFHLGFISLPTSFGITLVPSSEQHIYLHKKKTQTVVMEISSLLYYYTRIKSHIIVFNNLIVVNSFIAWVGTLNLSYFFISREHVTTVKLSTIIICDILIPSLRSLPYWIKVINKSKKL